MNAVAVARIRSKHQVRFPGAASLQRPAVSAAPGTTPQLIGDVLNQSSGQPLDTATRAFFEPRFGRDFSRVRVHTDARAADSAQAINARAYTLGDHLVFAPGQYAPGSEVGKRLLAHELVHTIQQAPVVAREADSIPAPPLEIGGPALERARSYQPVLRPHVPRGPEIPAPPMPPATTAPTGPCPDTASVVASLRSSPVASRTETEMRHDVSLAAARASRGTTRLTRGMIARADRAIRAEFGSVLPAGLRFTSPASLTMHNPADFARLRVPNAAAARLRIARVALEVAGNLLRRLCITRADDTRLQTEVATPVLRRLGINFVRRHEAGRIGGQTVFQGSSGRLARHVDIPNRHTNMGHIVVHEAMHFYVHDNYMRVADRLPIERQLVEGGAEFLARQVINQRLAGVPEFRIRTATYASEFSYVSRNLLRGGLSSFKLAYFQGRTDLLGIRPVRPKLAISAPGDRLEQEADRIADAVLEMRPDEIGDQAGSRLAGAAAGTRGDRIAVSIGASPRMLMRDLALTPPEHVPEQRELTPEETRRAIAYNRASYDADSTRLIQDLVGGPRTGRFEAVTVRLVARIQRQFGLVRADGKVGPDTFDLLIRELQASGTTPGTCLTLFQLVGPQPLRFFRGSSTQGTVGSQFRIRARFDTRCGCDNYQYRQHIGGQVLLREPAQPGRTPPATSGCATLASQPPGFWVWNMDRCFNIPGGGLTRAMKEDGDTAIPAGTAGHRYGYRADRPHPTDRRDRYLPNRPTGCIYDGRDFPELTSVPAAPGDSGDVIDWRMRFRGRIVHRNGSVVAEKWWSIINTVTIP